MDDDFIKSPEFNVFSNNRYIRTYSKAHRNATNVTQNVNTVNDTTTPVIKNDPLTTKNAMQYLLDGTLKHKVCRYCLNVTSELAELDQYLEVNGQGALYKVTIRDMVASFYPVKVADDPNLPDKICEKCLDRTISAYLFAQQCEQSERALRNCIEDMYDKLIKLDPLERQKKRGRQKLNPNYNTLYAEHKKVIQYAEPLINIINTSSQSLTTEGPIKDYECLKCCQVLPTVDALINHEKSHPKTMWYNCRLCGKSFPKRYLLKKHANTHLTEKPPKPSANSFHCNTCGETTNDCNEYLQHIEKHKFKEVMQHLVEKNMDELCSVCLDKSSKMTTLDSMVCLHGGHMDMTGDRNIYNILASTIPDMNILHNYTGTKICEKCLNNAITSYIFIHQYHFSRNRLNTCVDFMLNSLNDIDAEEGNVFVEISNHAIMPALEDYDENLLVNENDYLDESKLKVEVLEGEFRMKAEEEFNEMKGSTDSDSDTSTVLYNPAKDATQTYSARSRMINGYQTDSMDKVSEFLTFKKKKPPKKKKCKYTCPLCCKHFITEYFLKRHVLKHRYKKVECKYCPLYFKSKFYLYEHTKMVHILNHSNYYSCKTCGRMFLDYGTLRLHERNHRKKTCDLCDKIFATQRFYDSHMQRHAAQWRVSMHGSIKTCSFCEKECRGKTDLLLHVNKIHLQIKPYSCDMCDRQFYTEYDLRNHEKVHNVRTKEKCHFCDMVLKSRKQLVVHVRKHIGVTPYKCHLCDQSFYCVQKKRKHMLLYHGGFTLSVL
ncbi:LOW QUALITY PROTEIN: zinc finger protein 197 [Manduca sexta]|uniref:LOW QUALITY PROTEIN: zinc finger protein 197 n=1 Tax=Manduca sexta TaxID=7130 RepID=UPI00188F2AAE|nr:LOW QUALITY PROTEIN: zinc finger protein 197 [Manduca sexta]